MFYGLFTNANEVFENFNVPLEEQKGVHFLYAQYECESYEGTAGGIFIRDGRFYLFRGSHCSCYGLEDQWDPEEISLAAMRHYISNRATPYGIDFAKFERIVTEFEHLDTSVLNDEQIVMIIKLSMG